MARNIDRNDKNEKLGKLFFRGTNPFLKLWKYKESLPMQKEEECHLKK
jgi:hypothetical protein